MGNDDPFDTARLRDLIRSMVVGSDISVSGRKGSTKDIKESFSWG